MLSQKKNNNSGQQNTIMPFLKRIVQRINRDYYKLRHCFDRKVLVLIYHRVVNLDLDPQLLCVSPENFDSQMKFLKENYNVISLAQLQEDYSKKRLRRNSVVITFDDGYYDNLYFAKPILEKYNFPATFFVSTGFLDGRREYWWDQLEQIFLLNPPFKKLSIDICNQKYERDVKTSQIAKKVYAEIHPLLKLLTHVDRESVINLLFKWAEKKPKVRESHRSMTEEELVDLEEKTLFEVGAHTVNHPVLANESIDFQKNEILESKKKLEKILSSPITSFSYPFGGVNDYSLDTVTLLKSLGFSIGIANFQGYTFSKIDTYSIPRYLIRNWDKNLFKNKVRKGFKTFSHENFTSKYF